MPVMSRPLTNLTMSDKKKILKQVLEGLMRRYRERVPDVSAILETMIREGLIHDAAEIENDHIAFRSLGVPHLGIASLEKIFLHLGYVRRDPYFFPAKKLNAYWYAPPEPHLPRIFLSELRVSDLPERSREVVLKYTALITRDPVDQLDLDDAAAGKIIRPLPPTANMRPGRSITGIISITLLLASIICPRGTIPWPISMRSWSVMGLSSTIPAVRSR
jgi:hypothetical protein